MRKINMIPFTGKALASAILASSLAQHALAVDYGIFDARALAMGGTTLAVGNTAQGQYYNPALLAFHKGDEDKTRDGRTYFPTIVVQATDTVDSAIDAVDEELDSKLSNAVNTYNNLRTAASAGAVAAGASDLRKVLDEIANKDVSINGFFGLSVSEPSDHEGGAFYIGARVIGAGTSKVTDTDLALLDDYIAAMTDLAAGANPQTVAAQYPNLVNANGTLKDPTQTLNSSADVSALAISEWGMATAKEFTFWGQPISFGVTPKLMRVDAYRDDANFNTSSTSIDDTINQFSDTKSTHITLNADIGIAAIIAEHYRVGIAVKDLIKKDFTTHQDADPITGLERPDLTVKLRPRSRMGVGYVTENFSVGVDYDLQESTPMANEAPSQDLSLGAEYRLFNTLALRVGYRQDQTGLRENAASAGLGFQWRRFVMDIAYSESADMKAGGLQMGWKF
ncbi:conjugative transfer protein [Cellvibrio zantedeschiae]|uniref:Conjugative transfer protein n=1 Tax=Cellvibrio zantedeschiae TaxID=1237077 RepID=A0ABQ3BAG9_9GAMM|nr:conjugal transfer protein TraF [Cellvibrio zantedeschiae]GGY86640.1 conjugative transfer protein [Cellvibrio zantedeschiae]